MPPHRLERYTPPAPPFFCLVAEAPDYLVLSKQAGLLTVPGKDPAHGDCLEARVQAAFPEARIVHRLDMATSGLIAMAQGLAALRHLSKQFEKRQVEKRYQAIVSGEIKEKEGIIDLPIATDWPNRPLQRIDQERGRRAITRWQVLDRQEGTTRVALYPETGRSHQLRLHMKELGHPILGDNFYADEKGLAAAPRLLLHAEWLRFRDPATGEFVEFGDEAPF